MIDKLREISPRDLKGILRAATALTLAAGVNSAAINSASAQEVSNQDSVVSTYFQCGGDNYEDNHTVFVQLIRELSGNSYQTADLGTIPGQCGNTFMAPDNLISPLGPEGRMGMPVSIQDADGNLFLYFRTYTQCGGELGPMIFNPRHVVLVDKFNNPQVGSKYSTRDLGPISGQCGNP